MQLCAKDASIQLSRRGKRDQESSHELLLHKRALLAKLGHTATRPTNYGWQQHGFGWRGKEKEPTQEKAAEEET